MSKPINTQFFTTFLIAFLGKGIPDGIGADVKREIKDMIRFNPDTSFNSVDDVIDCLADAFPSFKFFTFSSEDVNQKAFEVIKVVYSFILLMIFTKRLAKKIRY